MFLHWCLLVVLLEQMKLFSSSRQASLTIIFYSKPNKSCIFAMLPCLCWRVVSLIYQLALWSSSKKSWESHLVTETLPRQEKKESSQCLKIGEKSHFRTFYAHFSLFVPIFFGTFKVGELGFKRAKIQIENKQLKKK